MEHCYRALRRLFGAAYGRGYLRYAAACAMLTVLTVPYVMEFEEPILRAAAAPACAAGVGAGGASNTTAASTVGGNGCVVVRYVVGGTTTYETFNYTGSDQTWTVPAGVSSINFELLGAGGGGATYTSFGNGGGGGYSKGALAVTAGQVLTIIVGQRGGGELGSATTFATPVSNCYHTSLTYGGGGRGGSCQVGSYAARRDTYSSGGGRSAIRDGAVELVTAGGGGGGGGSSGGSSPSKTSSPLSI